MKVFLTGANGFLGSHILDDLRVAGYEVQILLRRTSDTRFIDTHIDGGIAVRYGSLSERESLEAAIADADVVVHCAAKTKALDPREYVDANRDGTRNLIRAANARSDTVRHFVLISSLAVSGPGLAESPADETAPTRPVTVYGQSKCDGEGIVRDLARMPWTILRPAAVYGPRDRDFLPLFRAVKWGLVPLPFGGRQELSLVYGPDVAVAVRRCLEQKHAEQKVYHVAAEPPITARELVRAVAGALEKSVRTVGLPSAVLYISCAVQDGLSALRRRPNILSRQKWPELKAPGWVCSVDRIRNEMGFSAPTPLGDGLAKTAVWYREQKWL